MRKKPAATSIYNNEYTTTCLDCGEERVVSARQYRNITKNGLKRCFSCKYKFKRAHWTLTKETIDKSANSRRGKKQDRSWRTEEVTKRMSALMKEITPTGDKSPNWRGGTTPLQQGIRTSFEYKIWRSAVYERDNWTCQTCGIRGSILQAHHIKPLSVLVKEYNIKSKGDAILCSNIWDIDNGVTLCVDCHKLVTRRKIT